MTASIAIYAATANTPGHHLTSICPPKAHTKGGYIASSLTTPPTNSAPHMFSSKPCPASVPQYGNCFCRRRSKYEEPGLKKTLKRLPCKPAEIRNRVCVGCSRWRQGGGTCPTCRMYRPSLMLWRPQALPRCTRPSSAKLPRMQWPNRQALTPPAPHLHMSAWRSGVATKAAEFKKGSVSYTYTLSS